MFVDFCKKKLKNVIKGFIMLEVQSSKNYPNILHMFRAIFHNLFYNFKANFDTTMA
jgi:hypothetical protein